MAVSLEKGKAHVYAIAPMLGATHGTNDRLEFEIIVDDHMANSLVHLLRRHSNVLMIVVTDHLGTIHHDIRR